MQEDYLIAVQSQVADLRRMAANADSVRRANFLYELADNLEADNLEAETRADDLVLCSPE
jgi:hypothetical protein